MGVKFLATYIESCQDACKKVSIKEMADQHRRIHKSQPEIVADGTHIVSWLYYKKEFSLERIYGGQWLQLVTILKNLQRELEEIGVKLVIIFDGTIYASKKQLWIQRREENARNIASLFDLMLQNNKEAIKKCQDLPNSLKILARIALKELNVEVHQTNKEVDPDNFIAEYANDNDDVFAILSSDTDFIIYDTKPQLCLFHLDISSMQTILYDRKCLVERYLYIQFKQLPLFACLMGNDIVPYEVLKPFHERLLGSKSYNVSKPTKKKRNTAVVVQKICYLIRFKKWTGDFTRKRELEDISEEVFHQKNKTLLFYDGLKAYSTHSSVPVLSILDSFCNNHSGFDDEFVKVVNERHFNCETIYLYNLFFKKEYALQEVLEDGSKMPSALVYREIRRRCYGVLFNCYSPMTPSIENSVVIKERCAYKNNNLNEPELIQPLSLKAFQSVSNGSNVPRIQDLWFKCTKEEKLKVFCKLFDWRFEFWSSSGTIRVAVFIAQALWKPTAKRLKELPPPFVHSTAVNLSTLFISGIMAILMALETCDFPIPATSAMPWHFFDGKLFHFLYDEAQSNPSVLKLCKDQDHLVKEFYKLLPVVTNNTVYAVDKLKWKDVLNDFKDSSDGSI
ncbi:constitutive coactivator of peroxisome proliferator-activated receptor gamma [Trichonephila inaurata madagascariensis]|uniref:Constitutive coactivator of peroxisome proliferator-activated receptor gamma n=1 Tax=Trichonephila inaurata madagascariensis TaxID=2747483 RepID=A0A8X6IRA2_9ARAC|nr:constitutive coactivator of peroxisome proliferator-activated receptor gamma [Trichonephila inaurata madagascariensis]